MSLKFVLKLSLTTQKTNIGAQKINGTLIKTYGITLA